MLCWYTISADKTPPRALPFPRGPSKDEAEVKANYILIYVPRI